jgi:hypothetical protein
LLFNFNWQMPRKIFMNLRFLPITLAITAAFAGSAQAQSLMSLFETARSYDATYKAAQSQYTANLAKGDQAKALLLPTIGLSANINKTEVDQVAANLSATSQSKSATLSASQGISAVFHHTSSSLGSTLALKDFGGLCVACPPPSSSGTPAPVSSDASPLASPAELSRLWAALLTTCAAAQEERIGGSSASHPLYTLVLAVGGTLGVSCLPPLPSSP